MSSVGDTTSTTNWPSKPKVECLLLISTTYPKFHDARRGTKTKRQLPRPQLDIPVILARFSSQETLKSNSLYPTGSTTAIKGYPIGMGDLKSLYRLQEILKVKEKSTIRLKRKGSVTAP